MSGVTLFFTPIELLLHLNEAIGFLESETMTVPFTTLHGG